MIQKAVYHSRLGNIVYMIKDGKLLSLSFSDECFLSDDEIDSHCSRKVRKWLDDYFSWKMPCIDFEYSLEECTSFQKIVLEETMKIPYGQTITYHALSERVKERLQKKNMSCQAIGQALKKNPIALVIPCHRVIGKEDRLVGYAYGIERKRELLALEKK